MATVNELITTLGFKLKPDTIASIKKFDDGLNSISKITTKISGVLLGSTGIVSYFTDTIMGEAQELQNLSETTGYSSESLQKWKYAANASGISGENFIDTLVSLRKNTRLSEEGILSLADQFSKMSDEEALQYAGSIGISQDDLILMKKGSQEIRKLFDEAYVIPAESIKKTAEFNKRLSGIKTNMRAIRDEIFMSLSPTLVQLTEDFSQWMVQNKEFIASATEKTVRSTAQGFKQYVELIGSGVSKITQFINETGILNNELTDTETAAHLVEGALIAMTASKVISGLLSLSKGLIVVGKIVPHLALVAAIIKSTTDAIRIFKGETDGEEGTILDYFKPLKWLRDQAVDAFSNVEEGMLSFLHGGNIYSSEAPQREKELAELAKERGEILSLLPEGMELPSSLSVEYMDIPDRLKLAGEKWASERMLNENKQATINIYPQGELQTEAVVRESVRGALDSGASVEGGYSPISQ